MNFPKLSPLVASVSLLVSLMVASSGFADNAEPVPKKAIVSVGLGSIYTPKFTGADEYETLSIPVIFVQYDRFTLGGVRGISYDFFQSEAVKAGLALGYSRGRKESDAHYLQGLGSLKSSADLRLFVRRAFGPFHVSANIKRDFSEDIGGVTSGVSAGYSYRASRQLLLSTNALVRWMNDAHAEAVFGVTGQQAQNSGLLESQVEAGVESGTLSLTALYFVSRRWTINGTISTKQYLGDAKQSAITRESTPTSFMASASYRF